MVKDWMEVYTIDEFRISKDINIEIHEDDSYIIIGVDKFTNGDIYGYDFDIFRITKRKEFLQKKFTD